MSTSAFSASVAPFQALECRTPLVSRRWKCCVRLMTVYIGLFFLFAAVSDAAPTLPGQDEVDWPLMPVLLSHDRIAREAERLTGKAPTVRATEQQLQRVLRSRDTTEQRIAAVVLAAHYRVVVPDGILAATARDGAGGVGDCVMRPRLMWNARNGLNGAS